MLLQRAIGGNHLPSRPVSVLYERIFEDSDEALSFIVLAAGCGGDRRDGEPRRAPRSSELLFEAAREWGLTSQSVILDAGCRDAGHAIQLVKEHGCRAIAMNLLPDLVDQAQAAVDHAGLTDQISTLVGPVESIPLPDDTIDAIWCRDVLSLVADVPADLAEIRRIRRPGGWVLIYSTVARELMSEREAAAR